MQILKSVKSFITKYKYIMLAALAIIVLVVLFILNRQVFIAIGSLFGISALVGSKKLIDKEIKKVQEDIDFDKKKVDNNTPSDNLSFGKRFIAKRRDKYTRRK